MIPVTFPVGIVDTTDGMAGAILKGLPLREPSSPKRKRLAAKQGSERRLIKESDKSKPLPCRFHDLRHTGGTRMLEAGVPFSVVATIMGWSAATTVRMAKRYGHIGQAAQRQVVEAFCEADFERKSPQSERVKTTVLFY